MKSIVPPRVGIDVVLNMLGSGTKMDGLREIRKQLVEGETEYATQASSKDFRLVGRHHPDVAAQAEDDAKWAWRNRFSAKTAPARFIYDQLRSNGGNRCPLCFHRTVRDLDHFLPKSEYPRLALVPINLVPICSECNAIKSSFVATTAEEEPLHPYFDDLGSDSWLVADVLDVPGAPLAFHVEPPDYWSPKLSSRVRNQFARLKLDRLYSDLAANLISNIQLMLEQHLIAQGSDGVRVLLSEMATSWNAPRSEPYTAAALKAWSDSPRVCAGGWRV